MSIAKVFLSTKGFQKHIDRSILEPKYLARTLLLTSVSKDVFAYGLRVKNAWANQEIPEDKRKYVIRMDAASGITTGVVQIATGLLVSNEKFQNKITDKLFKSLADDAKAMNMAKYAFSSLSTMVIATLLAKRIVVPYIASKLASSSIFKDKEKQPGS